MPWAESMWAAGERATLAEALHAISDRVYRSTDRRHVEPEKRLGWPGVSCEMWGNDGARGGEGYGWGATLPAHIIRSIFGFREDRQIPGRRFMLGPNFPEALLRGGRTFALRNVYYRELRFDLRYQRRRGAQLEASVIPLQSQTPFSLRVIDEAGHPIAVSSSHKGLNFPAENHAVYWVELERA